MRICARPLAPLLALTLGAGASAQDIITREHPREWTIEYRVNLRSYQERHIRPNQKRMPEIDRWNWDKMTLVLPVLHESAGHRLVDGELVTATVTVDDHDAKLLAEPQLKPGYHSGAQYLIIGVDAATGVRTVRAEMTVPITAWQVKYNDEVAEQIDWPQQWPVEARSVFDQQMWIDMTPEGPVDWAPIDNAIETWTNGKDPRMLKPAVLAKFLAGEVLKSFQPSGNGVNFNRQGEIEGFELTPINEAAERGRGSPFDMVNLLAGIYRRVGLPARTVVGVRIDQEKEGLFRRSSDKEEMHAWVEFALSGGRSVTWVPVDILKMREKMGTRPRPLDQEWPFFGDNDEMDHYMPFAFHFHPPVAGVRAFGSAGFWGWIVFPEMPERADQAIYFNVMTTPRRDNLPRDGAEEEAQTPPRPGYRRGR